MNPDQVIATLAKGGKLDMEMIVANGRGYVPANENKQHIENAKIGFIPIDALYSPIERIVPSFGISALPIQRIN